MPKHTHKHNLNLSQTGTQANTQKTPTNMHTDAKKATYKHEISLNRNEKLCIACSGLAAYLAGGGGINSTVQVHVKWGNISSLLVEK
jgi:hypothetical protein